MRVLSPQEILDNCDPRFRGQDLRVRRYEIDVDPESGLPTALTIRFDSVASPDTVALRFESVRFPDHGPLRLPDNLATGSVYVTSVANLKWDGVVVEVGSFAEDMETFFWAGKVVELD